MLSSDQNNNTLDALLTIDELGYQVQE